MQTTTQEQLRLANLDQLITEGEANDLRAENARLRAALELIASYDGNSKFGAGICPYGCDSPNIAREAIGTTIGQCDHPNQGNGPCGHCLALRRLRWNLMPKKKPEPITTRVNTLLRAAMAERGLSRADMARALEISPVTVTKALNNPSRDWGITTLAAWAQAMGCELVVEVREREK